MTFLGFFLTKKKTLKPFFDDQNSEPYKIKFGQFQKIVYFCT